MLVSDPRCAELEQMLDGLDPRTELVYRLALRGLSPHCAGDRRFNLQTDALQALLRLDEAGLAEILSEARDLRERLAEGLGVPSR
jgi:hypothetical protein